MVHPTKSLAGVGLAQAHPNNLNLMYTTLFIYFMCSWARFNIATLHNQYNTVSLCNNTMHDPFWYFVTFPVIFSLLTLQTYKSEVVSCNTFHAHRCLSIFTRPRVNILKYLTLDETTMLLNLKQFFRPLLILLLQWCK